MCEMIAVAAHPTYYLICGARAVRRSVWFLCRRAVVAMGVLLSSAGRLIKAQEGFTPSPAPVFHQLVLAAGFPFPHFCCRV